MVQVREMREADIEAVSAIRVRGWQSAYAGLVPRSYLTRMTVEDDACRRRIWFSHPERQSTDLTALHGHTPVGWISFGPWRGKEPELDDAGEVYALYVRPGLTGQGIGSALLGETHARMRQQGFTASLLWVLSDHAGARRFYQRAGYRSDGVVQGDVYDDVTLTETRYRYAW
ncbi:GNAT family N-acetyltransferase [Streptomyces sp. NPDC059740]|uniref:GNAT family N-acetyltransferase n=1 Tax=Streptomyces sp. NPDC059740 TaxID=3346926 RepID=UPI003668D7D9